MGAVTVDVITAGTASILFLLGLGYHVYGFALNEYLDRNVDRGASDLGGKPLVDGSLSPLGAAQIAALGLAAGLGGSWALHGTPAAWSIVCAGLVASTAYNLLSKKLPFADIFVAASMFLLVLLGATLCGDPTALTWVIAALMGLELWIQNTVAHFKDLESDRRSGARNAALVLGARVDGSVVIVPAGLGTYLLLLRLIHLAVASWGVLQLPDEHIAMAAVALAATQAPALWAFVKLTRTPPADRREFLPHLFRHEFLTLLAMTILLLALTGWTGFWIFVVFPLAWGLATVRLVHGGELPDL